MNHRPQPTLRAIARRAKVSPSLVSCILRGKGRVSATTLAKVQRLLEKADYRPKYAQRPLILLVDLTTALAHGKSIPAIRQLQGLSEAFAEQGFQFHTEFLPPKSAGREATRRLRAVFDRNPGGVFYDTSSSWFNEACAIFGGKVPLVQIGYDIEKPEYSAVVVDSYAGALEAVRYLIANGHRRIGTVRFDVGLAHRNSLKKHAGYLSALGEAGIRARPEWIADVRPPRNDSDLFDHTAARRAVERMLESAEAPTALFVENDILSLPLMYPMAGDSGSLPERLRKLDILHFEDLPLDPAEMTVTERLGYPRRETLAAAIEWETIGRLAAGLMIDHLREGRTSQPKSVRVAPVLQRIVGMERLPIHTGSAVETNQR